jgi:hypothetical protein
MLPIRRISTDLREVRWGHVLIEFVMLVVGILLALAVNNWVEDRRDARIERQYLERLVRDLDQTLETLDEFARFETRQSADGAAAYRALANGVAPADRDAVAHALSNLTTRRTIRITRATYSNLIGTGDMRMISSASLRDQIVRHYEQSDRYASVIDSNNRTFVDAMYVMYTLDRAIVRAREKDNLPVVGATVDELANMVGPTAAQPRDRVWDIEPGTLDWDVLLNKVWFRTIVSLTARNLTRDQIDRVSELKAAVEAELARL